MEQQNFNEQEIQESIEIGTMPDFNYSGNSEWGFDFEEWNNEWVNNRK